VGRLSWSPTSTKTMIEKHLLCPERVRRVPPHFSWVDHRLVRDPLTTVMATD